jgi:hypothetical protein
VIPAPAVRGCALCGHCPDSPPQPRYASTSSAGKVEGVLAEQITNSKQVRRVTLSVLRYLLRCVGRPTPFGMFAGVAPVQVGSKTQTAWEQITGFSSAQIRSGSTM